MGSPYPKPAYKGARAGSDEEAGASLPRTPGTNGLRQEG